MVVHGIASGTAIAEVDFLFIKAQARRQRNKAAFFLTRVTDVVDDGTRGLRGKSCRAAAADGFEPLDARVEMCPVVVVTELDIAEQYGGQSVFLQLHEGRAARRNRQTAHRDVGVTTGTRGTGNLNSRNHAEDFRFGRWLKILDQFSADAGDRD